MLQGRWGATSNPRHPASGTVKMGSGDIFTGGGVINMGGGDDDEMGHRDVGGEWKVTSELLFRKKNLHRFVNPPSSFTEMWCIFC